MFLSDPRDTDVTFARPSEASPFAWSLRDLFPAGPTTEPDYAALNDPGWADINRMGDRFVAAAEAAERQTRLVDTINARQNALIEAADNRIRAVRDLTGIEIENPFRDGYAIEARRRIRDEVGRTGGTLDETGVPAWQLRIFNERLDAVAEANPDKAAGLAFGQSLDDQAQAIARSAEQGFDASPGGVVGFVGGVAGGLWGSRRDPLFLGTLLIGPAASAAQTAIGRIAMGALKQGFFNAGVQAAAQPAVQDWRREIGARYGIVPALENVGMAFLFGAIPGAGVEGVRLLAPAERAAVRRLADGTPKGGDAEVVAKALGTPVDDDVRRAIATADAETRADVAASPRPDDIPADHHTDLMRQAVEHAEDPAGAPPPDLPVVAAAPNPVTARVTDDAVPVPIGDVVTVDGKPATFSRFAPNDLKTDAATFQYKGGGDEAGVTDRLKSVTKWDPLASGKTIVFERADGTLVVADGHQRLGLAKRLFPDDASIRLDGYLFREVDGWTPEDVRAIAAKKNMQEGSGTALDAARILRDRPDLIDASLPISSPMMKNAIALSRLSEEAWGMVVNGVVPENHGAVVGAMVPDKLKHAAIISDMARDNLETERQAKLFVADVLSVGFHTQEQIGLFGAELITRSLIGDRVRVLDEALKGLRSDKRLFGTLAEKANDIEAAGNRLDRSANDARQRDAAQLEDLLARLARRTGPVSDALNRQAALLADGSVKRRAAADAFLDDVRALLDRDGLTGLLAEPQLKPAQTVEPGTPDALAAAETARAERDTATIDMFGDAPAPIESPPAKLFDSVAVEKDGETRMVSREQALADAARTDDHAAVISACDIKGS